MQHPHSHAQDAGDELFGMLVQVYVGCLLRGSVLSGNIGCAKKMKFGCLGDPVNLASRLEGLCKHYGVDVICSGDTYDALEQDKLQNGEETCTRTQLELATWDASREAERSRQLAAQKDAGFNFVTRKLALVQVKGKREPTWVYEVMARIGGVGRARTLSTTHPLAASLGLRTGASPDSGGGGLGLRPRSGTSVTPTAASRIPGGYHETDDFVIQCIEHKRAYESALAAYHGARFGEARELAGVVLQQWPKDTAAKLLLEQLDSMGGDTMALTEANMATWTGTAASRPTLGCLRSRPPARR
mmetsp:Transcript_21055/g.68200  ORF Transcript_21055/g.68200 Transcript_21055/m.68200 type:complete len:301 (-) Transcript_21055:298-1200(-)